MNKYFRYPALLAVSCIVAACASQPATIPFFLKFPLSKANISAVASLRYEDQGGHPISEAEFADQYEKTRSFALRKSYTGALPDVTVRVASIPEGREPEMLKTMVQDHQRLPAKDAIIDFNSCAHPIYPKSELRAGHTGTVTMSFLVGVDGHVKATAITTSSGFPGLDEEAMTALIHCRFRPAMVDSVAKEAWSPVRYVWTIQ